MGPNYYEYKPNRLFGFLICVRFACLKPDFYAGNFGIALESITSSSAE